MWHRARPTFRSKVVGPHFEQICREWSRWHAAPETHGGQVTRVAGGTVNDPAARTSHEVDIAVHGAPDGGGSESLLAIGKAKWNDVMERGHLERLQHIRSLLTGRGMATDATRLQCFRGAGFTTELHRPARNNPSIQLIDPNRLYHGA